MSNSAATLAAAPADSLAESMEVEEEPDCSELCHHPKYLKKKEAFEKTHFFCHARMGTMEVVKTTKTGLFESYIFFSNQKLREVQGNNQFSSGVHPKTHKKILHDFVDVWLTDPKRREYRAMMMCPPPQPCDDDVFNSFQCSPYEYQPFLPHDGSDPKTYDIKTHPEFDRANLKRFIDHGYVMMKRNEVLYDWLLSFFAHIFQYPGKKPGHMITLSGAGGTGKSMQVDTLCSLLAPGTKLVTDNPARDCFGNFTPLMESAFVVVMEECQGKELGGTYEQLKERITGPTFTVEKKGVDGTTKQSYHRFIQISNSNMPNQLVFDSERRIVLIDCGDERTGKKNPKFFKELAEICESPRFRRTLYWVLKTRDIEDWNFSSPPQGELQQNLTADAMKKPEAFYRHLAFCEDGEHDPDREFLATELLNMFRTWEGAGTEKSYFVDAKALTGVLTAKESGELKENIHFFRKKVSKGMTVRFNWAAVKTHFTSRDADPCLIPPVEETPAQQAEKDKVRQRDEAAVDSMIDRKRRRVEAAVGDTGVEVEVGDTGTQEIVV